MTRRRLLLAISVPFALTSALAANKSIDDAQKKLKDGKYEEAIAELEAEHKKNPKNDDVKMALSQAHFAFGEFQMYNKQVPPMKKYPGSLREFRKVMEYDPGNTKAKSNIGMIESLYKSMGKPVPQ